MPYQWTQPHGPEQDIRLTLWPHRSLPRRGFAAFVLTTFTLITIPLYPLLGTFVLWGVLPFLLMAVGGIWWALEQSYSSARIEEVLTIGPEKLHLRRTNPRGDVQEWSCNRYWASVHVHLDGGPVTYYITINGAGREVEIGAFLSEDERKTLYAELADTLRSPAPPAG
ncbi:Uncharacterized membrane protein [Roseovarius azorensis]|uniref:Uncharacterized membrane protein n=1 Tax=Roseovarius azorensis TaxID=1287727 RepID=A0A1H7NGH9_9RHOB|nr:DUF2244 domain-containing protein [Roseovarius azorensis]SEL22088.1 Uncharacterized membrane protein [Roseovarius azorensis]